MPEDRFGNVRDIRDPRRSRKPPRRIGAVLLIAVLALFAIGIAFEQYGHYAYVRTSAHSVTRVDRFTGDTCVMPCAAEARRSVTGASAGATPERAAKTCHSASIVRVAGSMKIPPGRPPFPYHNGGMDRASAIVKHWGRAAVPNAAELTDGHVYVFSASSFAAVGSWSSGDAVDVCAIYSKIERRPFFSIRSGEDAEPADIAI